MWNISKVTNEDTRGTSMFLIVSMSMRSFWWIQLYLNLFQYLSSIIYFIWYVASYMIRQTCVPPNVTRSTKLWGVQRSPELAFRSTGFRVPENLIFPALYADEKLFHSWFCWTFGRMLQFIYINILFCTLW